QFLSHYKVMDYVISQKLAKNIIIRLLCTSDEDNTRLIQHLVPFIGYASIKQSLPKSSSNSLLFIRDNQDIFSFSIDIKQQLHQHDNEYSNTIFSLDNWSYSKDISIVKNAVYCFNLIWEEKENKDKTLKEKMHSELLFDLLSHDIGNYHQIIQNSLDIVTSLVKENDNDNEIQNLSQNKEEIFSFLMTAKKAIDKSQSLLDNIRRLERLYTQKDLKLIPKNLPDAINNAHTTLKQTLYNNNPLGKTIRFSLNIEDNNNNSSAINITAEDLLEEIFINLFSNSVKYAGSSEVKIDVLIKEYFIAEVKYWMITIADNGNGIPDTIKKELFNRFYSKAKGTGLGLSIVKTLVERYKGKIWVGDRVYEDYKQGTVFGIIFPALQ
ncbi:MAG: HAMP domain-containing histidine kinase, partial [Thermoproteota archaeon]|nr:HAMP domain-containing histidine kinase [Thermoproteota archaeon]